jgi:hypothetical protein
LRPGAPRRLRLEHIAGDALGERFFRGEDIAVAGEHENASLAPTSAQGPDQLHATAVFQRQIRHHDLRTVVVEQRQGIANAARCRDDIHVRRVTHQVCQGVANDLVILNDQDANHADLRTATYWFLEAPCKGVIA